MFLPLDVATVYLNWKRIGANADAARHFEGLPWERTELRKRDAWQRAITRNKTVIASLTVTTKGVSLKLPKHLK